MTIRINKRPSEKSFAELIMERLGLSKEEFKQIQDEALKEKKSVLNLLIEKGYLEEDIAKIKAEYFGFKFDKLTNYNPPEFIKDLFTKEFLKNRLVLPLEYENNVLTIAMYEPTDVLTINQIVETFNKYGYEVKEVNIIVSTKSQIEEKIDILYEEERKLEEILDILKKSFKDFETPVETSEEEKISEKSSPIIILAHKIIEEAHFRKASDIHIQPFENKVEVRYRIDGVLHTILELPKYIHEALVSRYKIMSNLKIDEKRLPQDGRINFLKYNPSIDLDLRVSTVPTVYGEDIVMRLLEKKSELLNLDRLGFTEENLIKYKNAIKKPYGMILHTGPTGSGKTTTLYSALKEVDNPGVKIVTVEDPVEYTLGGSIVQTSINLAAGYTFAKALKAFLRHDPDIILVGEIRDLETAKIAVEASLTGHLVFSTLHTNDAVSTVTRLTEMGIESYLLADSLLIIVAQRLAKRICNNCKTKYTPSKKEIIIIENAGFKAEDINYLYKGKGCKVCNFTGYKGRIGIHEVLEISDKLRDMLIENKSTEELRKEAIKEGMKTLRQDAVLKAIQGITTIEEVERITID